MQTGRVSGSAAAAAAAGGDDGAADASAAAAAGSTGPPSPLLQRAPLLLNCTWLTQPRWPTKRFSSAMRCHRPRLARAWLLLPSLPSSRRASQPLSCELSIVLLRLLPEALLQAAAAAPLLAAAATVMLRPEAAAAAAPQSSTVIQLRVSHGLRQRRAPGHSAPSWHTARRWPSQS